MKKRKDIWNESCETPGETSIWTVGAAKVAIWNTFHRSVPEGLLIGIVVGVLVKLFSQWILGVPLHNVFRVSVIKEKSLLTVFGAAVFSNWLGLKKILDAVEKDLHLFYQEDDEHFLCERWHLLNIRK